jgi:Cu/Zn superoxide dismutase
MLSRYKLFKSLNRRLLSCPVFLIAQTAAAVNQASPGSDPGLQPKEAVVVFNNGVTGDIHLSQANFKSPLEMKLDLTTLRDSVGPWHIHRLPVQDGCSANSTSGHYNPFNVTATYKTCKDATECEAGDLSTKFGVSPGHAPPARARRGVSGGSLSTSGDSLS